MPSAEVLSTLLEEWEDLLGAQMAQRCRVEGIQDGRLHVAASDPAAASEIGWLTNEVMERINSTAQGQLLTGIDVRVEPADKARRDPPAAS